MNSRWGRLLRPAWIAVLVGCGASSSATRTGDEPPADESPPPPVPSTDGPAGHGEVCQSAEGLSRPCAAGLSCCYPCGIEGCDHVCHTEAECDMDRLRP